MERIEGYYWVKLPGVSWQPAFWHDNNGDGSDFMWRVHVNKTSYGNHIYCDDDFSEINETRIPAPDEQDLALLYYREAFNTVCGKNVITEVPFTNNTSTIIKLEKGDPLGPSGIIPVPPRCPICNTVLLAAELKKGVCYTCNSDIPY